MMKVWRSQGHPCNKKRDGICICYKNFLSLNVLDISLLDDCSTFDLKLVNKLCSFKVLYRSSNQSQDDFAIFPDNFELTLDSILQKNLFLLVALGNFNAKLSQWYNSIRLQFG